jgi:uncharacterized protein YutE (UPF0331/DUF86 family)
MVRRLVVERKLQALSGYLEELQGVFAEDLVAYEADPVRRRAAERLLQLVVEVAVDVNTHVAAELGQIPEDSHHSFVLAGELGLIRPDLATALAPSAGLRNRLVPEYEALDDRLVHAAVGAALRDYPDYLRQVMEFLER